MLPDIASQATAVERAAANLRGHIETLRGLVSRGRRPQHELDTARAWLPDLEAAAMTLRKFVDEHMNNRKRHDGG